MKEKGKDKYNKSFIKCMQKKRKINVNSKK